MCGLVKEQQIDMVLWVLQGEWLSMAEERLEGELQAGRVVEALLK